jgi:hypothetical protein
MAAERKREPLRCEDFKKNADGSWTNIRAIRFFTPDGNPDRPVELPAGLIFSPGDISDGLDIGEVLKERCH